MPAITYHNKYWFIYQMSQLILLWVVWECGNSINSVICAFREDFIQGSVDRGAHLAKVSEFPYHLHKNPLDLLRNYIPEATCHPLQLIIAQQRSSITAVNRRWSMLLSRCMNSRYYVIPERARLPSLSPICTEIQSWICSVQISTSLFSFRNVTLSTLLCSDLCSAITVLFVRDWPPGKNHCRVAIESILKGDR